MTVVLPTAKSKTNNKDCVAAICASRNNDSRTAEFWKLVHDMSETTHLPDEDVLFVRDEFELAAQLEKKNPAPAGFTYLKTDVRRFDGSTGVYVCSMLRATAATAEQIFEQARKRKVTIDVSELGSDHDLWKRVPRHYSNTQAVEGAYVLTDGRYFSYAPQRVRQMACSGRALETRRRRYGLVPSSILLNVAHMIITVMSRHCGIEGGGSERGRLCDSWCAVFRYDPPGRRSLREYVCRHVASVLIVMKKFGMSGKVHKHKPYKHLLRTQFADYVLGMQNTPHMEALGKLLEAECRCLRIKLTPPPPRKGSGKRTKVKEEEHAVCHSNESTVAPAGEHPDDHRSEQGGAAVPAE
jgi:hypothetical protein